MRWQPNFVAYAAAHGRTPEQQAAADVTHDGRPTLVPFLGWINRCRAAFLEQHPRTDWEAYEKFVTSWKGR